MKKTFSLLCVVFLLVTRVAQSQTTASVTSGDKPSIGGSIRPTDHLAAKFAATYGHLPLSFEANEGQTDKRVQFLLHAPGYSLFLQPDAATLSLSRPGLQRTVGHSAAGSEEIQSSVMRMQLLGASPTAKGEGDEMLAGKTSYLLSNHPANWHTNVPNYRRVTYRQVYPGIDLVYYGANGQLEYDFELSAGADPARIQMHFDGVVPSIDAAGDVNLKIAGKSIVLHRPVLYQQVNGHRVPVSGNFALNHKGDLVFVTGAYDRSVPLVIDPLLQFSSYFGGVTANNTQINGMAIDATGAVYVTGTTVQTDFPVTAGAAITTCPSNGNGSKCGSYKSGTAFVSKISADGQTLVYSTYMGGSDNQSSSEQGNAITVDSAGEAWVVGTTSSPSFPITSDAIQSICAPQSPDPLNGQTGPQNGCSAFTSQFLVKLNAAGSAISYGTYIGGGEQPYPNGIALDSSGDVYITGSDSGSSSPSNGPYSRSGIYLADGNGNYLYPTTTSAYQETGIEQYNFAYLTKLSADGHTLLYSTIFDPPALPNASSTSSHTFSLALGLSGSTATIGGYTNSSVLQVTANAIESTCTANSSGNCVTNVPWLASFDTSKNGSASLVFATYLDGPSQVASNETDEITALASDASGNIFAGGYTVQPLFPTTTGVFQPSCAIANPNNGSTPVCSTGFVTKLASAGAIAWSTFFGSTIADGQNGVAAIALDASDNVYITNGNAPSDMPVSGSLMTYTTGAAYIAQLSSDGTKEPFGTFYGNGGVINTSALAVDANQDIFIAGSTTGSLPLVNAFQTANSNGYNEGVFAKISHLSATTTTLTVSPASTITGQSVTFTAAVAGTTQTTPAPTGTVTLVNNSVTPNPTLGTILLTNGTGTYTTKQLAAGSYSVTASYPGDGVYNTSVSSAATLKITTPTAATIALTVPGAATLGASVKLGATVSGSGGTPTGSVSFYDGGTLIGSGTLSYGATTYSTSSLALGTHSITAMYSGDSVFGEASSSSSSIDITTAATINLTVPASAAVGSSVALSVTISGSGATPSGTVKFFDGTTTLNSATLSGGKAIYSTSTLAIGAHSITVQYSGDEDYSSSTSAVETVTISALVPTIALTAPETANVGSSVALSVSLSGSGATPTGSVKFLDGTTILNSATLAGGKASFISSSLTVGNHSITAQYSGDSIYAAETSTALTLTINALTPVVALKISPTTASAGASIALSATVTASSGTPTGTVKFLDGTAVLNTATLASSSASYSTTSLAAGTHSITASYSGDTIFAPVTTAAQTVTITTVAPSVTLSADRTSLVIIRGQSGSTVITATPAGGYTGSFALSCGMLPADASCVFSTTTITVTSTSPETSTLTISTQSTQALLNEPPGRHLALQTFAALLLPMLLFSCKRRRAKSNPWIVLPLFLLCVLATGAITGCGGAVSKPAATPPGSYSLTVNATGGTANSLELQVTVQ